MRAGPVSLLVTVLGLTACSTTPSVATSEPPAPTPTPTMSLESEPERIQGGVDVTAAAPAKVEAIVMIGDSITVAATPALDEQFGLLGYDDVTIVAQEGKRMGADPGGNARGSDISRYLAANIDRPPQEQLWIVALGTNDVGNSENIDAIVGEIDDVLEPVPTDVPLVWINTYVGTQPDGTEAVNAAIAAALAERGNAAVGRWDEAALADGVISGDGVHPTEDGSVAFATLVTTTVADFLS